MRELLQLAIVAGELVDLAAATHRHLQRELGELVGVDLRIGKARDRRLHVAVEKLVCHVDDLLQHVVDGRLLVVRQVAADLHVDVARTAAGGFFRADAIAGIVDTREPRSTRQIELLEYQLDHVAFLRRQFQRQCRFTAAVDAARTQRAERIAIDSFDGRMIVRLRCRRCLREPAMRSARSPHRATRP